MRLQRRRLLGGLAIVGALPRQLLAQASNGRVGLVVSQSRQPGGGAVAGAAADARLMEQTLQGAGFSVVRLNDPNPAALRAALAQLSERLRASPGLAVLHYSGAGFARPAVGSQAEFWMWCGGGAALPSDSKAAFAQAVPLRDVWRAVDLGADRALVVTVDSAYTWPFGPAPAGRLRWPDAPRHAAVLYSDAPGAARGESAEGHQGRFTQALARQVLPGVTIDLVQRKTMLEVMGASGGKQSMYSTMDFEVGAMHIAAAGTVVAAPLAAQPAPPPVLRDDPKGRGRSARVM